MSCLSFKILGDDGLVWAISLDSQARIEADVSVGATLPLELLDVIENTGKVYQVRINTSGFLYTTQVSPSSNTLVEKLLDDGVNYWKLIVDGNGLLYTKLQSAGTPDPVIGQLLPMPQGYAAPLQPGGIGTVVTSPAQTVNEAGMGRYRSGCGHGFNNWEIIKQKIACGQSALICCPTCRYLQRIITPYEAIHDIVANQLIQA